MTHANIKLSANIELNFSRLFDKYETFINELDLSASVCKSRAYAAEFYKHTHIVVEMWLLPKQQRMLELTQSLLDKIENPLKIKTSSNTHLSMQMYYRDENYRTMNIKT